MAVKPTNSRWLALPCWEHYQFVDLFGLNGPRISLELAYIDTVKYSKDNIVSGT